MDSRAGDADYRQAAIGRIDATLALHTRPEEVFISSDEPGEDA